MQVMESKAPREFPAHRDVQGPFIRLKRAESSSGSWTLVFVGSLAIFPITQRPLGKRRFGLARALSDINSIVLHG